MCQHNKPCATYRKQWEDPENWQKIVDAANEIGWTVWVDDNGIMRCAAPPE